MMKQKFLVVMGLVAVVFSGCASGVTVKTNGFLNQDYAAKPFGQESRFCVVTNTKADNVLFDEEIGKKLERLIQLNGYRVAGRTDADFLVEYAYGVDKGRLVTDTIPEYRPGDVVYESGRYQLDGKDGTYSGYTTTAGYIAHVPVERMLYTRNLIIKVKQNQNKDLKPVWIGESYSSGQSDDLRQSIDFLLVGTFKSFGKDTQNFQKTLISMEDAQIMLLRGRKE
jgi:hypothetical protein